MKKVMACIATALMLITFTPIQSKGESNPVSATEKESAEVKALIDRVNEINAMDRSTMSRSEKKEIRSELRAIKREVNRHRHSSGIFISTGVLVLILILIIII